MPHKWIVLFTHSDWLTWRWLTSTIHLRTASLRDFKISDCLSQKITFWCANYSPCVVYTETIIHLSVSESDGYLPQYFALGKYPLLVYTKTVDGVERVRWLVRQTPNILCYLPPSNSGKMASRFASVTSEEIIQINFLWCILSHCFSIY